MWVSAHISDITVEVLDVRSCSQVYTFMPLRLPVCRDAHDVPRCDEASESDGRPLENAGTKTSTCASSHWSTKTDLGDVQPCSVAGTDRGMVANDISRVSGTHMLLRDVHHMFTSQMPFNYVIPSCDALMIPSHSAAVCPNTVPKRRIQVQFNSSAETIIPAFRLGSRCMTRFPADD